VKSEHINPCIEATIQTYKTMLKVTPVRSGDLAVKMGVFDVTDITGVIGLSGTVKGAMMLTMEKEVACKTVGSFLEKEITAVDDEVLDGIGEILNIIAGAAAAKLSGYKIQLGLPTVLQGKDQRMFANIATPWIIIPMNAPGSGRFDIAITMDEG
jgi:chemotaxis protein CheX